jgi:ankyrin repeat protein
MKGADIEARNKEDEAPIFVAAKALDVDTVSYLLECNAQVDDVNDGRSLLPVSCRHGLQPIVKLLLDKGFDVETVVKGTGLTLLGIACQFIHGDAGMVEMLLEYGADVEARDSKGRSPLAIAAANASNPRIIVALLEAGADLEGADSKGATPLMMAALLENVDVVKVLLEYGASCEAVNNAGSNATHYCSSGNEVILQSLRRASEINEAAREVVPILK